MSTAMGTTTEKRDHCLLPQLCMYVGMKGDFIQQEIRDIQTNILWVIIYIDILCVHTINMCI